MRLTQEITANEYSVLWKVPLSFDKVLDIQPVFDNAFTLTEASEPRLLDAFMLYSYALEGPRSLVNSSLTIQKLSGTGIDVLVDIRFVEGEHHTFLMEPTSDAITIPGKPDKWEVVKSYTILGIEHILLGFDHLLFFLAVILIWRLVKRYFTRLSWQRQLLPYAIGSVAAFWFIERVAGF